jgi:integrase
MADLRGREGIGPRALEFTILTASRSGESVKAEWSEFDLDGKVWTVPAVRMKGKREHRVTLSDAAVAILRDMEKTRRNKFVFPSDRSNKHMSDMTLTMLLRRMSADAEKGGAGRYVDPKENNRDVVPHGFRSSFKDWARERTGFANEVSEAALAHVNGDKVEAAYARGDMFDKRRKLMDAWAAYCASPAADGQVIPMRRGTDQ